MSTISPPSYFFDMATTHDAACAALILGIERFEKLRGPKIEHLAPDGTLLGIGRSDSRRWSFHLEKTPNFMASFAAELYLKGLVVLRRGAHKKTHDLEKMFLELDEEDREALDRLSPNPIFNFSNTIGRVGNNFIILRYWTLSPSEDPKIVTILPFWMLKALRDYVNTVNPEGAALRDFTSVFTQEEKSYLSGLGYL